MKKWWFSSTPRGYVTAAIVAMIMFVLGIGGGALSDKTTSDAHSESSQK